MNFRLVVLLAIILGFLADSPLAHSANEENSPATVRLGMYLVELEDFDTKNNSFTADFWIWGLTDPDHKNWTQTLDYPNSIKVETSQATEQLAGGKLWSSIRIAGEFRVAWDLRNHPFDKGELEIRIEESFLETSRVVFESDSANSHAADARVPKGWRITNFSVTPASKIYSTAFGNPSKPPKSSSEYAQLAVKIGLERDSYAVFWKLTAIPYIATILAFLSFFVVFDSLLMFSRFSLLIGSLFAACVSLRGLNSELESTDVFTLMDTIHVATLGYVLFAILCAIISRDLLKREVPEQKIFFWNMLTAIASLGVFVAVNVAFVWNAMNP